MEFLVPNLHEVDGNIDNGDAENLLRTLVSSLDVGAALNQDDYDDSVVPRKLRLIARYTTRQKRWN